VDCRPAEVGMVGKLSLGALYGVVLLGALFCLFRLHHFTDTRELAAYLRSLGALMVVAGILLTALQAVFTPLPLFLVAGTIGFVFGVFQGTVITLTGSLAGAVAAFYLARGLRCGLISRTAEFPWRADGLRLVFLARMVPVIPSSLVSYVAGASRMRFSSFFLATVLGSLPEIVLYTFLGRSVGQARALNLWISAGVLVPTTLYFFLAAKKHLAWFLVPPGDKG